MHFKFWGQSLNKGTWLTVAAKDTNYFHQTVVITIKSCLSINQLAPPHQSPAQHAFQSLQEVMNTISSLPLQENGGGDPSGNVPTSSCFQLYFNVIETSRRWNKVWKLPSRPSTREFISQRYSECAWEFMEVRDQCKVSASLTFYLCISWLDWLPREPRGSSRLCFLPLRLQACIIIPRFWHVWSEFESSCYMLMRRSFTHWEISPAL